MILHDNALANRRTRGKAFIVAACWMVLLTMAHRAGAETLLAGNLGPGNSFQTGTINSWANGGTVDSSNAVSFTNTTGQTYTLSSILFADNWFAGTNTLNIGFLEGSDLNSATLLESFTVSASAMFDQDLYTVTSVSDPLILPGETYFLTQSVPNVLGDTTWGWQWNNTGQTGFYSEFGSAGWITQTDVTPAFAVYGSLVTPSAVPEPSSLLLIGTGLAGVATQLRRRSKR
jgi:hypothetical protein